jgi:hypothetical protein
MTGIFGDAFWAFAHTGRFTAAFGFLMVAAGAPRMLCKYALGILLQHGGDESNEDAARTPSSTLDSFECVRPD